MYSVIIICGAGAIMYNDTVKKIYTERVREAERGRDEWGGESGSEDDRDGGWVG